MGEHPFGVFGVGHQILGSPIADGMDNPLLVGTLVEYLVDLSHPLLQLSRGGAMSEYHYPDDVKKVAKFLRFEEDTAENLWQEYSTDNSASWLICDDGSLRDFTEWLIGRLGACLIAQFPTQEVVER